MSHRGRKRGGGQGVHVIDSDDGADRTVARAQLREKVRTKAVLSPVQDEHFSDFDPLPQAVLALCGIGSALWTFTLIVHLVHNLPLCNLLARIVCVPSSL